MGEVPASLVIEKGHLVYLRQWFDVPVIKSQNRHRNEFLKMIEPFANELETQRIDILKPYVKLDAEGNIDNSTGRVEFIEQQSEGLAQKEYQALLKEKVAIAVSKPKAYEFAQDFLKKMEAKFNFVDGLIYDEICEEFGITDSEAEAVVEPGI
jgi:DNA-binding transcriptional regulator YhcF (GntR family)